MIETINHVNKEVARELEIREDIVKKVNGFFWKEVNHTIASGAHTSIYIKGLCTLTVSRNKVNVKIYKLIREIRYFRNTSKEFKRKTRVEYLDERLDVLRLMLERRNEVAIAYKANYDRYLEKKRKKQLQNDRTTETGLGQQTLDSDGDSEQILFPQRDQSISQQEVTNM
jgi:hypothetical protein